MLHSRTLVLAKDIIHLRRVGPAQVPRDKRLLTTPDCAPYLALPVL